MFLGSKHEYRKDELSCEYRLDEEPLCDGRCCGEFSADVQPAREQYAHQARGGRCPQYLDDDEECCSENRYGTDEAHTEGYL